ncbi:MAG: hypothetical protein AAF609_03435 [Cyanobacteria bacterium P01_C01_bin.120]
MGIGVYLHKALENSAKSSLKSYSLKINYRQLFLWGAASSLLWTTTVQATPNLVDSAIADATTSTVTSDSSIEDGLYFYGAVAEPDVPGAAYLVFQAQDTKLIGALFMPQSSFDCFQGQLTDRELALQITNSYTQEVYGYEIALIADDDPIATANYSAVNLQLDGFHNLGALRETEMAILSTCQADFSQAES